LRKTTIIVSCSVLKIDEWTAFGFIGASSTKQRFFHLTTVFGLMP
jgi:hypothetical protein